MPYKLTRKRTTPKELGVSGDTAGDFLLDLQKKLPISPLDAVSSDGTKLSIGKEKMEIKLPKNKEIGFDIIEKILTEGTILLLEENRDKDICDRKRIKVTMSLGDNTIYFAQGHLTRSPDGTIMPMYPILQRKDDTFVRVIDSMFTSSTSDLEYFIRKQHNRTLGRSEEDRTQELAEKLGFVTIENDESVIDVKINGVTDSCMVTRLCIHSNEFNDEETLLKSIIKTYRDIQRLKESPLIIIGLNDSIDVTISRDRKTITIENRYEVSENIKKIIRLVTEPILTKETLENAKIEYKENVRVEEESLVYRIYERIGEMIEVIDNFRERHGHKIVFGGTLITIPLIFLFFLYSKTNPTNSYLQATIATIPSIVIASIITREYRKPNWIRTFGQKKFPAFIWFLSIVSYAYIHDLGFGAYLEAIFYLTIISIGIVVIIMIPSVLRKLSPIIEWVFSPVVRLFSPIAQRLNEVMKSKVKKPSIFESETIEKSASTISMILNSDIAKKIWTALSMIMRVISTVLGVIGVLIFVIAFLPMAGLFVIINLLNRGYWQDLEKYREDIIEKAVHKYRDERNLAPSCRVIFKTTKCKRLKNPLSGSWNVLRKKAPRLLTTEGFVEMIDKLVLRGWM